MGDTGSYTIGPSASKKMLNSMMYKMCYHRFDELSTVDANSIANKPAPESDAPLQYGYDRARNTVIGRTNVTLSKVEEAFTSSHWMVRIYRVLKEENRG